MAEFVYDAFISYRRSDGGKTARWLRRELEAFHPPRALRDRLPQKLRVYLDTAYERGALDFFENTIRPALLASRFLIAVATSDAVLRPSPQDDWIKREIDPFAAGPNGGNLLLVRGGCDFDGPPPADLAARFPHMEIIDLRNVSRFWRLNPLRASRISGELLKLIAPIAGVALEDMPLLRREQEYPAGAFGKRGGGGPGDLRAYDLRADHPNASNHGAGEHAWRDRIVGSQAGGICFQVYEPISAPQRGPNCLIVRLKISSGQFCRGPRGPRFVFRVSSLTNSIARCLLKPGNFVRTISAPFF